MTYDLDEIAFAMCGVRLLSLMVVFASVSYAAKSRAACFAGCVGCFLGYIIPEPKIYAIYSSAEAAYMAAVTGPANHRLFYGFIGAAIGCGLVIFIRRRALVK